MTDQMERNTDDMIPAAETAETMAEKFCRKHMEIRDEGLMHIQEWEPPGILQDSITLTREGGMALNRREAPGTTLLAFLDGSWVLDNPWTGTIHGPQHEFPRALQALAQEVLKDQDVLNEAQDYAQETERAARIA